MITRKLLAAFLGLSLAAGTLGTASAQISAPAPTQSASPSDTMAPTAAAKSDVKSDATMKKAPVRKHHARMTSKTHRKHVSQRATKHVATKHTGLKVAQHANKRVRVSHLAKHGTKHA